MADKGTTGAVAGGRARTGPPRRATRPPKPPPANDAGDQGPDAIAGDSALFVTTSMPDDIPRHSISDEELNMLCDPSRDELWETKWAALGVFIGVVPNTGDALWDYFNSANGALTVLDLIYIVLTFVSFAVWFVLRIVVKQKTTTSLAKRDEIRARTKKIVEAVTSATLNR